ncbi:MAG TPA: alpha/beta hydrolase [Candidatus Absconditabacterales bacterium]|nr:alpha/beta hydrolase [Candidatus Absconditabacterales bacterium]HMT27309.1 alpha/beta hydrolase [Candidatus Absconditabacterales bacterium]
MNFINKFKNFVSNRIRLTDKEIKKHAEETILALDQLGSYNPSMLHWLEKEIKTHPNERELFKAYIDIMQNHQENTEKSSPTREVLKNSHSYPDEIANKIRKDALDILAQRHFHPQRPYQEELESIDGEVFRYIESGNSNKPLILNLHGLVGQPSNFLGQHTDEHLNENFHQISLSLYKHFYDQEIEKNQNYYSNELFVKYIKNFLDQKTSEKIILEGVSFGGEIAYNFAAQHPEKISGLILSGASGLQSEMIAGNLGLKEIKKIKSGGATIEEIKGLIEDQFDDTDTIPHHLYEDVLEIITDPSTLKKWFGELTRRAKSPDIGANSLTLSQIRNSNLPVYLLRGDKDKITPPSLLEKYQTILGLPSSQIITFPTGHTPNIEQPHLYNKKILEIFSKKPE